MQAGGHSLLSRFPESDCWFMSCMYTIQIFNVTSRTYEGVQRHLSGILGPRFPSCCCSWLHFELATPICSAASSSDMFRPLLSSPLGSSSHPLAPCSPQRVWHLPGSPVNSDSHRSLALKSSGHEYLLVLLWTAELLSHSGFHLLHFHCGSKAILLL